MTATELAFWHQAAVELESRRAAAAEAKRG
jgi:hypothetical protein